MRQLSALDTLFLALESPTTYGHVSGLAIVDPSTAPGGTLTLDDLKAVLTERLHLLPVMRWKLAEVPLGLDRPYWVEDDHFDLDFHVRELALPAPGDDRQLAEQTARIVSRPLDRSRPLWELYLVHGLPEGRMAMLTKIHHAMVDGMSGAEIMGILYDLAPEGREVPPDDGTGVALAARPGTLGMLRRGVLGPVRQPIKALGTLPRLLPAVDVVPSVFGLPGAERISRSVSRARNTILRNGEGEVVERPAMRAPRVPFSGRVSAHRRFAFGSVSLSDVKRVKDHYGVKVNDVVVALSAAAVRQWLIEHDALPDRPLLAQIPVSVRTDEQRGTFGNRISVMIVPIPTDQDDPEARLRTAHEHLIAAKDRHKALPAQALQDITQFIPPAIYARSTRAAMALSASGTMRPMYNLVISNVPGPPIPIYMAGAKLLANYPVSVATDGAGLNITVLSYLDSVDFGIVACREQMPDVETLMDTVQEELQALLDRIDAAEAARSN